MISKNTINFKKLSEKEFSVISWLNNTLRATNHLRNDFSLQDELLNISKSCTSIIMEYNELIESQMSIINDTLENFYTKNDENNKICQDLNNKINEFSNTIKINEQKYSDDYIEKILYLFEQKEKLQTVLQLLINNSKFESLLHEIEDVLNDKKSFILLINEKKDDFQNIINKLCSLKLLVSSLESIPEFLARIERFKNLENGIMLILDNFFNDLFIQENSNEDTISELIDIYFKLDQNSRLFNNLFNIISQQILLVWKFVWSLTTFGSQNKNFDSEFNNDISTKINDENIKNHNIILLSSIEDLNVSNISKDVFRIREDEAITRYFNWFNELINSRNYIIKKVINKSNDKSNISDFIQNIIKKLLNTCIKDIKHFLETILISITNSKFIFPENNSENFDMVNESIFEIDQDTILTTDIKEIKIACQRIFNSFFNGINFILTDNNKNDYSFIFHNLNSDHINQITNIILNESNIIQSILLCDIAWIFQSLKSISSDIKSIISNQIPVTNYSIEVDSKCMILNEKIEFIFSNEYSNKNLNPMILKNYMILFIYMIDFSIKFFFENALIHLLNPIQCLIRTQTLNLIKNITQKKKNVDDLIITNILDKELLDSCFSFYFSISKAKQNFINLIIKTLNYCQNILLNSQIDKNENKNQFFLFNLNEINLNQYSIFNRIKDSMVDSFNKQIFLIMEENNIENSEILNNFESIKFISQISLDSIDIIAQCCCYPVLAFFEGYNRLNFWNENINEIIFDSYINQDIQSIEKILIPIIEKYTIQPSNPIVSIGEYLLNIVVTLESICNNPNTQIIIESEFIISEIIKRIIEILEDTIRRQVIEIEFIGTKGCLQLFVDTKYLLNISEILLLYNRNTDIQDIENQKINRKSQELECLNTALIFVLTNAQIKSINEKKIKDWYQSILQKKNLSENKIELEL